ncbi:MAG: hypothetical protein WAN74_00265 [Thermoplasmata archaeon]
MVPRSTARYRFRKNFRVSADEAYSWLTDFGADDLKLMGGTGTRDVHRLTPDVYLLVDHIRRNGRKVLKAKLVHLYPKGHARISTYIGGPSNRSQFVYQIEPRGRHRSRFTFTGLQMEEGGPGPPRRSTGPVRPPTRARRFRDLDAPDARAPSGARPLPALAGALTLGRPPPPKGISSASME